MSSHVLRRDLRGGLIAVCHNGQVSSCRATSSWCVAAHQPSWPLQFTEPRCTAPEVIDYEECGPPEPNTAVYIVEGDHPSDTPYAPRAAWDAARTS